MGERTPRRLLHELLRWMLAIPIAAVVAGALFVMMAQLIDGSWLVEALIRVFPLEETELTLEERCAVGPERALPAVSIEGTVGTLDDGVFVPLADAELHGERAAGEGRDVEVDAEGRFRFVTALPGEDGDPCATDARQAHATPQLVLRAPGCHERRVPLTRAWVPRRILLTCDARG